MSEVSMEAGYPHGSRQWWLQVQLALNELAGTYTRRSLYERASRRVFKGLAAMCGRRAARAKPAL